MDEIIKTIPDKFTLNINIKGNSRAKKVEIEAVVRTSPKGLKEDIVRKLKKREKREVSFQV